MKLVIDINNSTYEAIKHKYCAVPPQKRLLKVLWGAIKNGTPLPKGHGDLIDRSNLITIIDIRSDGTEFTYVPYSEIEKAPTIIEADKAESEGKE